MKPTTRGYRQNVRAEATRDTRLGILAVATEQFLARAYEDVTLQSLSEAAGVSRQTILNHFGSKEGVLEAVANQVEELRSEAPAGDVHAAITLLLDNYERMGDANIRMLAIEGSVPVAAQLMQRGRKSHQAWLAKVFADQLPRRGPERTQTLALLHAATDVYVWKLLRRDLGYSRKQTQHMIERLSLGALAHPARMTSPTDTGEQP